MLVGMAADVSTLVRLMNGGHANNESGKSTAPITRDLLGGCCSTTTLEAKELDLDLQVPCGWEKRLDLKSGKVYLQRCISTNSSSSTSDNAIKSLSKFQDLNFPPTSKQTLNLFENPGLDLKLVPSSNNNNNTTSSPSSYQSVCTLEKVKTALERAEKESGGTVVKKRSVSSLSKSCSPRSNSSSSVKLDGDLDHEERSLQLGGGGSFAAGCPSCLLYVLISVDNPKCPRCNNIVPLPIGTKKPKIDLNISM